MSKVLYVTDLDGTLLRSNETISTESLRILNDLIQKGVMFSYATARSLVTAEKVTDGLKLSCPVILYNGAFIVDSLQKQPLISNFFTESESQYIKEVLAEHNIFPIVYSYIDGIEKFSYHTTYTNREANQFLSTRRNDIRCNPVQTTEALYSGNSFYFTCIGNEKDLLPAFDTIRRTKNFHCIYQKDIYSHEQWLEILPLKANKASALLQLKEFLQCDKAVAFGDGKNDLSMFEMADECYAVENADPSLKKIATGMIKGNDSDGVAKWLFENVKF